MLLWVTPHNDQQLLSERKTCVVRKAVTVPAMDMVRIVGGKAVEIWGGPDQFSMLQQIGIIS